MSHRTCQIDGCEGRAQTRGWCGKHYGRWKRHGDPLVRLRTPGKGYQCSIDDCEEPRFGHGLCSKHYTRQRRYGDPRVVVGNPPKNRVCSIDGCDRKHKGHGFCPTHLARWKRNGDAGADRPVNQIYRTAEESFSARTEWRGECLIWTGGKDDQGYGAIYVEGHRQMGAHRYAWERVNGPIPDGLFIDHYVCYNPSCVNVEHLRVVTQGQNNENRKGINPTNKTTGVRGVIIDKTKFRAQISRNNRSRTIGHFDTLDEADRAVREARLKYYTHSEQDKRWKAAQATGGDRSLPASP